MPQKGQNVRCLALQIFSIFFSSLEQMCVHLCVCVCARICGRLWMLNASGVKVLLNTVAFVFASSKRTIATLLQAWRSALFVWLVIPSNIRSSLSTLNNHTEGNSRRTAACFYNLSHLATSQSHFCSWWSLRVRENEHEKMNNILTWILVWIFQRMITSTIT